MKNVLLIVLAFAVMVLGAALGVLLQDDPSTSDMEIDRDRAMLTRQISDAKNESKKYSGRAVKAYIDLRIAILSMTDAMLEQKRATLFRRIRLNYPINIQQQMPGSTAELDAIIDELRQAERKADSSRSKAQSYSGELVQGIALMTAETDELSVSALRLKFYALKHGFPVLSIRCDAKPESETKG